MTRRDQQHARTLKRIFDQLNLHLAAQGLPCLTYKDLGAQVEPNLGKSAVSNLLNGKYQADTAGKNLDAIARILSSYCEHHNFTPVLSRPQRATLVTREQRDAQATQSHHTLPTTVRVSQFGFFRYGGKHYYAGHHIGQRITILPGDEPHTVTIGRRELRPIDPDHNLPEPRI